MTAAVRETREETSLDAALVTTIGEVLDDHGGWTYTTVLARPARAVEPDDLRLDGESEAVAWVPLADLDRVPLHPGLAASLDRLVLLLTA
jgi:8-oxo-dGTP pyrophosphatase MutT (NUDIX family)